MRMANRGGHLNQFILSQEPKGNKAHRVGNRTAFVNVVTQTDL